MISSISGVEKMSMDTFCRFRDFIQEHIGISIPDAKKVMVESRLLRRLKALKLYDYSIYADYLFSTEGQHLEVPRFIECITTNKTDFFREIEHFIFLNEIALPEITGRTGISEIRLWSGASSTGEEAYTMAMFIEEFKLTKPDVTYKILATDISEKVLDIGRKGIYPLDSGEPIPTRFKKRYCLKGRDESNPTLRIKKELRRHVSFKSINLTDDSYQIKKSYHIIFLRNVMIYFNKDIQKGILNNLYKHLHPEGFLFLGHSENIPDHTIPFKRVGPSIYVKKEKIISE